MYLKSVKKLSYLLVIPALVDKRRINYLKQYGICYNGDVVGFEGSAMTGYYAKGDLASTIANVIEKSD